MFHPEAGFPQQKEKTPLEIFREATPEQHRESIETIGDRLKQALYEYLARPNSDPEVIQLVEALVDSMDHSARLGSNAESLRKPDLEDLKAGLIGARMVLTPGRERAELEIESVNHVRHAAHFLELARDRVGTLNPRTGDAEIAMKVSPNQRGGKVTHRKE
ncbi:MAG: hypothetical protein HYS57_01005 [Parcubacteria group bacterium]|nr:hypothetical protein [Parcubacteria group bacterium]